MMQKYFVWLAAALLGTACTKDGDTIYLPDPNEEQASSAPLVTVIYGGNSTRQAKILFTITEY